MTDNNHPITPPPELIEDWIELAKPLPPRFPDPGELATLAARWGYDQAIASQAVLDAFHSSHTGQGCLAAALRAAVDEVAPEKTIENIDYVHQSYVEGYKDALYEILIFANELETSFYSAPSRLASSGKADRALGA